MSREEQITGTRFAGKVSGCIFDHAGDPEVEVRGAMSVVPDYKGVGPMHVDVLGIPGDLAKIQRGDNVTVTVEVTREPE